MLAIIAAILFGIAWIINATGTVTNVWFSVTGLLLLGLGAWPASGRNRQRVGPAPLAPGPGNRILADAARVPAQRAAAGL